MKKLILLFLLFPTLCFADAGLIGLLGGGLLSGSAPSGTYTYAWNGDHGSGTNYLYYSAGADVAGTINGAAAVNSTYGYADNGVIITDDADSITYSVTANTVGTIWLRVDARQVLANWDGATFIAGIYYDGQNSIILSLRTDGVVQARWEGTNVVTTRNSSSTITYSVGTFELIGLSWDTTGGAGACKLSTYQNGSWEETTTLTCTAWANTPNVGYLGPIDPLTSVPVDDEFYLDNYAYIAGTYQGAQPW